MNSEAFLYARYVENLPEGGNVFAAVQGFKMLGYEIVPFYGFGDIPTSEDLLTVSCMVGYVGDVIAVLTKLNKKLPNLPDYPEHLKELLGREISVTTLGEVKTQTTSLFVKPLQQKLFTGCVWDNSRGVRLSLASYEDTTPVYTSPLVDFVSEYRVFVLDSRILGVQQYRGVWPQALDKDLVIHAVSLGKSCMPRSYALDFGVTSDGKTLLVEVNDSYALGHYGLRPNSYALMVEARWRELTS